MQLGQGYWGVQGEGEWIRAQRKNRSRVAPGVRESTLTRLLGPRSQSCMGPELMPTDPLFL